jgi:hypothetical protein
LRRDEVYYEIPYLEMYFRGVQSYENRIHLIWCIFVIQYEVEFCAVGIRKLEIQTEVEVIEDLKREEGLVMALIGVSIEEWEA